MFIIVTGKKIVYVHNVEGFVTGAPIGYIQRQSLKRAGQSARLQPKSYKRHSRSGLRNTSLLAMEMDYKCRLTAVYSTNMDG